MTSGTLEATGLPVPAGPPTRTRRAGARTDLGTKLAIVALSAILLLLIGYPLIRILVQAFDPAGREVLGAIITSAVNRQILLNTVVLGTLVGAIDFKGRQGFFRMDARSGVLDVLRLRAPDAPNMCPMSYISGVIPCAAIAPASSSFQFPRSSE